MSATKATLCLLNFIRMLDKFCIKFGPVYRQSFRQRALGDVLAEAS